jgi:hypothetical protein
MFCDTRWHRHLAHTLNLESPTDFAPFVSAHRVGAASIKLNSVDDARAVANITAWRAYLPEACIAAMLNDGWQWTT